MAFIIGPRQAGKTWIASNIAADVRYLSWDNPADRGLILENGPALVERAGLDRLGDRIPVVCFDELHKFPGWKVFLNGFFDAWEGRCRILVTGSAALDDSTTPEKAAEGKAADGETWKNIMNWEGFPSPSSGETGASGDDGKASAGGSSSARTSAT